MKKLKILPVIALVLTFFVLVFSAGCGVKAIAVPNQFDVDEGYLFTWTQIEHARGYMLDVRSADGESYNKQISTRKAEYNLGSLSEGDYIIRVKAVSATKEYADSEWSEEIEFHKGYESGCIYNLINNDAEYELTKVGSATGSIDLGDIFRGKPVTSIAGGAFKGSGKVTSIRVGNNVTAIGNECFYNCTNLTDITLPAGLQSIGKHAFHGCKSLESIALPSGVTEVPEYAFAYCRAMTSVRMEGVEVIADYAFDSCSALVQINLTDSVKSVGVSAFDSCTSLESVTVGGGLTDIAEKAFNNCEGLKSVTFAQNSSLATTGEGAFSYCTALESIALPEGLTDMGDGSFYGCSSLASIQLPSTLSHIGYGSFMGTKLYTDSSDPLIYADGWVVAYKKDAGEITRMDANTFKAGTVGIADRVFEGAGITGVDLCDTVKYIGKRAFANNTSLKRLYTYEDDVTRRSNLLVIDDYAFFGCSILDKVFLNEGLKKICYGAFMECSLLDNNANNAIIPDSVTELGGDVFKDTALYKNSNGVVYAGKWVVGYNGAAGVTTRVEITGLQMFDYEVRGISDYAFSDRTGLQSVTLDDRNINKLKFMGKGAFYNCISLASVSISPTLEKLEDYTFYGCKALVQVSFRENVKEIGRSAFYNCERLARIDLGGLRVTNIAPYAFYNCINLTSVDFGDYLESIGDYAFYKCKSLQAAELPDTLRTIGLRAFYKCEGLETLSLGRGLTEVPDYAFSGCTSLKAIAIPVSVTRVGKQAFYNCSSAKTLAFEGSSVEVIDSYAFAKCTALERAALPAGLKVLGSYAFMRCDSLLTLIISSDIEEVGNHAFYGCTSATFYTDCAAVPANWGEYWNSSFRPVVYSAQTENGVVKSITTGNTTVENPNAMNGKQPPEREGYICVGWTDGENIYSMNDLPGLEAGKTLTPVWEEYVPPEPLPEEPAGEEPAKPEEGEGGKA